LFHCIVFAIIINKWKIYSLDTPFLVIPNFEQVLTQNVKTDSITGVFFKTVSLESSSVSHTWPPLA
jgi:hypothetical protein